MYYYDGTDITKVTVVHADIQDGELFIVKKGDDLPPNIHDLCWDVATNARTLREALRNPPEIKDFRSTFDDDKINSRIQSQAARKNPAWKKSVVKAMKKYGFELVGAGINGAVFKNPQYPFVLKVYRTDQGYDEWLYFMRQNQANKFVPKVKGNLIRLNRVFNAVRLEPLVPCPDEQANAFVDDLNNVTDAIPKANWYPKEAEIVANAAPDMLAIGKFMRYWETHGDLTPHNVMCRENGEIVLIDPLYADPNGYSE